MPNNDEPQLVYDPESDIWVPLNAPIGEPPESAPIMRREEPKAVIRNDAAILQRFGWGVGDILEGSDGVNTERVEITAVGRERVLGILISTRMKDKREWEAATAAMARERMFTFTNRTWKKAEQ